MINKCIIPIMLCGNFVGAVCSYIFMMFCQSAQTSRQVNTLQTEQEKKTQQERRKLQPTITIKPVATAVDVARYIIYYLSKEHTIFVNNHELQCLLYFAQTQYAINNPGKRLFEETIRSTQYGVCVQEVFDYFCGYGVMDIFYPAGYLGGVEKEFSMIQTEMRKAIEMVLDEIVSRHLIGNMGDRFRLSNIIMHQKPWIQSRENGHCEITVESLVDFFSE